MRQMRLTPFIMALPVALVASLTPAACGSESDADPSDDGSDDGNEQLLEYADAGIPERPDAGPEPEVEICLPIAPLPPEQLPRCTAATRDCIAACPEGDPGEQCRNDCWANDPTPPAGDTNCNDCVFVQLLSCIDAAPEEACHPAVAGFLCCLLGGSGACEAETNEMFTCGYYTVPECFDLTGGEIGKCYAETDP